jgi:hypothetical protein
VAPAFVVAPLVLAFPCFHVGLLALPLCGAASAFDVVLLALAFPCILIGLLALPLCGAAPAFVVAPLVLAFPCFHVGLLALPLCGAAPTFFAAAKKVGKESSFTPQALRWVPWLGRGSGASGIRVPAHSASVTKPSSAPTPHCVRRGRVCQGNQLAFSRSDGHRLRLGEAPEQLMVFERSYGARSAAGRMTALSLPPNARGHGFQMHHYPLQARGPT